MRKWPWAAATTATHWAGGWWGPHAPATPVTSCRCSLVEPSGATWPTPVAASPQANQSTQGFTGASLPPRRAATFSTSAFTVRGKPFVVLVSVPQSKPGSNWLLYIYICIYGTLCRYPGALAHSSHPCDSGRERHSAMWRKGEALAEGDLLQKRLLLQDGAHRGHEHRPRVPVWWGRLQVWNYWSWRVTVQLASSHRSELVFFVLFCFCQSCIYSVSPPASSSTTGCGPVTLNTYCFGTFLLLLE